MMVQKHKNESGSIVIGALLIVVLCSAITAGLFWQQNLEERRLTMLQDKVQAEWLLRGFANWSRARLRNDLGNLGANINIAGREIDRGENLSNHYLELLRIPPEKGSPKIQYQILDAQSRFNLTNLWNTQYKKGQPQAILIFERLLEIHQIDKKYALELVQKIILTGEAIRHLRDVPILLNLPSSKWNAIKNDLVLLPTPTPLNINTANNLLLKAYLPELNSSDIESFLDYRIKNRLTDLKDLNDFLIAINKPPRDQISNVLLDVKSLYFMLLSSVTYNQNTFSRVFLMGPNIPNGSNTPNLILLETDTQDL